MERIYKVHSVERETTKRIHVVWRETDKNSNDYQTRFCVARSMEKLVKPLGIKEKPKLDDARPLRRIYFIDPDDEEYKETQKHEEKTGKTYDTSHAM